LFWVCDAVYFEAKLFAGIDKRMHVSECIEHPDLASAAFWEVGGHVEEIRVGGDFPDFQVLSLTDSL